MKKIIALVIVCFAAMIIVFIPAGKALRNSYSVNRMNKEINMKFLAAQENGYSVKADNNGDRYIISPANYDRLNELLNYRKISADEVPTTEGKDRIKLTFPDDSVITVVNLDEEGDIAVMIYEESEKVLAYTVEGLKLYKWLNEVVDGDGYTLPNKRLPDIKE